MTDQREQALAAVERIERYAGVIDGFRAGEADWQEDLALVRTALAPELPADLAEIQARADAATPGPWERTFERSIDGPEGVVVDQVNDGIGAGVCEPADAEFIAHARTDVPALIAELAERRDAPQLTPEEAALIIEWSYVIGAKHYTKFPDRADAMLAKLDRIQHNSDERGGDR